jgi:polyisoprenoid-binding protein YceI
MPVIDQPLDLGLCLGRSVQRFRRAFSFEPENVAASKLAVTIKTDSLQTQFAARDKDLKDADWFNVTEFPEMTFVGTEFVKKDEHAGTITGKLTLHGTTKPVTLNVVLNKVGQNPLDKQNSAGFSARGRLKRSDFGMKTFLGAIGDDVDIYHRNGADQGGCANIRFKERKRRRRFCGGPARLAGRNLIAMFAAAAAWRVTNRLLVFYVGHGHRQHPEYSLRQLVNGAAALRAELRSLELGHGDIVSSLLPNGHPLSPLCGRASRTPNRDRPPHRAAATSAARDTGSPPIAPGQQIGRIGCVRCR